MMMAANERTNKSVFSGFLGFSFPLLGNFTKSKSKQTISKMPQAFRISMTDTT